MDDLLADRVRTRAGGICEYCRLPDAFHPGVFEVEHVIALKHGGPTALGNLAYSCLHCNRHKGTDLAGIDRVTSRTRLVRLFNPRRHKWGRHFRWDGALLVGITAIGRVTIHVLQMNDPTRMELRQELIDEGVFPP
jgi:hypothetical protein